MVPVDRGARRRSRCSIAARSDRRRRRPTSSARRGAATRSALPPRFETYFFSHAGFRYPSPNEEDYFLARLTLVVPPEYQCVANGELVAEGRREDLDDVVAIEKAGSAVYTFATRSPVKYMSFIVGKLDRLKERPGPVPITAQASSEILHSRPDLVDQAADVLDFYVRSFGDYPYEKLAVVLRLLAGLRRAQPGLLRRPQRGPLVRRLRLPGAGRTPPWTCRLGTKYFLAHEIAHQWWGQGVSFGTYKDQWLSEGLAQFSGRLLPAEPVRSGGVRLHPKKFSRWTVKKSFRGPIAMGSRLSYQDFAAYQAIVYDKAALALFMLQDLIGRDAFQAGLRAFYEQNRFRTARTGDFMKAMASASGRDLEAFFKGWFSSWELPEVRTTRTETALAEGVRIDLRIIQTKGLFVFPLWIEWVTGGKAERTMVVVDEATEVLSLTLPRRPDKVRVNPDRAVPGDIR